MTQKERLIELLKKVDREYEQHFYFPNTREYYLDEEEFEYLAQHLLDNGVIVPPCKVGDTVYAIDDGIIYKEKVDFFDLSVYTHDGAYSGEEVFTTREEAEQSLREREKE